MTDRPPPAMTSGRFQQRTALTLDQIENPMFGRGENKTTGSITFSSQSAQSNNRLRRFRRILSRLWNSCLQSAQEKLYDVVNDVFRIAQPMCRGARPGVGFRFTVAMPLV